MSDESLLEFPCRFPIKAMGLAAPDFDALVVQIVRRHAPDIGEGAVTSRLSRSNKYLAVTVVIEASSKAQLDSIYQELTAHERVIMAL
jgi:putative lipoic acid-binding regulatory protein